MAIRSCPECDGEITQRDHAEGYCPYCDVALPPRFLSLPPASGRRGLPREEGRSGPRALPSSGEVSVLKETAGAPKQYVQWGRFLAALNLYTFSLAALSIGMMLVVILALVKPDFSSDSDLFYSSSFRTARAITTLLSVVMVSALVGLFFATWMAGALPRQSSAQGLALAMRLTQILTGFFYLARALAAGELEGRGSLILGLFVLVLGHLLQVLFLILLMKVVSRFRNDVLWGALLSFTIIYGVVCFLEVVYIERIRSLLEDLEDGGWLLGLGMSCYFLIFTILVASVGGCVRTELLSDDDRR